MERLAMNKTREILRLRWTQERTVRETALATGASTGVVSRTESRARRARLSWEDTEKLDDTELERRLYGGSKGRSASQRPRPDPAQMNVELKKPGVTLELLHLEYLEEHPEDGLRYTAFADVYRAWRKKQGVVFRQDHKAGEKAFVDYSGVRPEIVDPATGEVRKVELFVGVLGASNFTFVEATESQRLPDFVASHVRMLEYFGGVPRLLVPDQLRSAVKDPDRYEPTINRTYAEFGRHYDTAVVPARPRKPKDKAKVEGAVLLAQRWILARLRHEVFSSLPDLNLRIAELLEELNDRPRKKLGGRTRRELFETIEKPKLRELPEHRFEVSTWKRAKVAPDYHVAFEKSFYSVPHTLVGEEVEVRATAASIEVYFRGNRVASHLRKARPYTHSTLREHMPEAHRAVFEGGERVRAWADSVGQATRDFVEALFAAHAVEAQGWRSAQGLRRLESKYGRDRLERACAKALALSARSYKVVERLLKLNREAQDVEQENLHRIEHVNIRGEEYYH